MCTSTVRASGAFLGELTVAGGRLLRVAAGHRTGRDDRFEDRRDADRSRPTGPRPSRPRRRSPRRRRSRIPTAAGRARSPRRSPRPMPAAAPISSSRSPAPARSRSRWRRPSRSHVPLTIDGTDELTGQGTPAIVLSNGGGVASGLDLEAGSGGSTIEGLEFIGFTGPAILVRIREQHDRRHCRRRRGTC